MIYFDETATTKPHPEVINTYLKVASDYWYNPSSPHKLGLIALDLYQQASDSVRELLKLNKNKTVFFTKGGTEANNFSVYGVCNQFLGQKKHIITTKIEHPSVLACLEDLSKKGFEITYLNVDEDGIVSLDELVENLQNNTILISVQWVNNIVGTIQPIKKIIEILKDYPRIKLHVDGVQGIGKVVPDFDLNDIDLFTISAHKIHGLKGAGVLIHNSSLELNLPLKSAGNYPGTIDLPSVVACVKALQIALKNDSKEYVNNLHAYLKNEFKNENRILINGQNKNYSPYLFNCSIKGKNSETAMHYLEQFDIYVATGSACSSKLKKADPTILSMTNDEERAKSSLRISLSADHSLDDVKKLVNHLKYFAQSI